MDCVCRAMPQWNRRVRVQDFIEVPSAHGHESTLDGGFACHAGWSHEESSMRLESLRLTPTATRFGAPTALSAGRFMPEPY